MSSTENFEKLTQHLDAIQTPAYVIDEKKIEDNLKIIHHVKDQTGCTILHALKAFSAPCCLGLIRKYLDGASASSVHEAMLANQFFGKNVHVYSPGYKKEHIESLTPISNHIIFNSFSQWESFRELIDSADIEAGLRINPEYSEVKTQIYNPCSKESRFGVREADFRIEKCKGLSGLHFHALCEQGADTLERVWEQFEQKFGAYLHNFKWINLGGGHALSNPSYDLEKLISLIQKIQKQHDIKVILEPGAAIAYDGGFLVSSVVDLGKSDIDFAILDTSATAHMPDVIEMPYRPHVVGSGRAFELTHTYHLGGSTCLSGDMVGTYSFAQPLKIGDKIVLTDMAQYTMVKTTTFNGVELPTIYLLRNEGSLREVASYGYDEFVSRLGRCKQ